MTRQPSIDQQRQNIRDAYTTLRRLDTKTRHHHETGQWRIRIAG